MANPNPKIPPPGPGRPKGQANKATKFCRDLVQSFLDNGAEKFEKEFNSLSGKEYCAVYSDLMEYCAPKLARTELISEDQNKMVVEIRRVNVDQSKPTS